MFFKRYRLNRIINKAVSEAAKFFKDRSPAIAAHFYYGAIDIAPQHLVVWYLFKTEDELIKAENSGLCDEINKKTKDMLLRYHYPPEAFEDTPFPVDKISFENGSKEEQEKIRNMLSHGKAVISFTTQQDIKEKANGDYRVYFQ